MNEKVKALCHEIGDIFGRYFEENGQVCIDNGEKVFRYNSEKDLLTDWVDTLVSQHLACNGESGGNWEDAVTFIYKDVIGKYPTGVRPYNGKKKVRYKAESYAPTGTPHGVMVYLGTFDSIIDAIGAVWKHKGITF